MVRALRSCRLTEATAEAIVRKAMARRVGALSAELQVSLSRFSRWISFGRVG